MRKDSQRDQPPVKNKLADRFRHRYWDLQRPSNSSSVEPAARSSAAAGLARFRSEYLIRKGMIPVLVARTDADKRWLATT